MELKDKVSLITGAGSGIGRAISILFAKEGSSVIVNDIDEKSGQGVVNEIKNNGGKANFIKADVSKFSECKILLRKSLEIYKKIDILINNAGIGVVGTVITTSEEDFDRIIAVNLKGTFLLSKVVIQQMIKTGKGVIVNIASVGGIVGIRDRAVYCASKGAIISLTKCMALDHVHQGIRVNCVCPGTTETPWIEKRLKECEDPVKAKEELIKRQPMGRLGTPEEIAYSVLHLASDESSFVTGSAFIIDGGLSAGK